MITREQIERIAANCGVEVSYVEPGKGGFVLDSIGTVYSTTDEDFYDLLGNIASNRKVFFINDERTLFAA